MTYSNEHEWFINLSIDDQLFWITINIHARTFALMGDVSDEVRELAIALSEFDEL